MQLKTPFLMAFLVLLLVLFGFGVMVPGGSVSHTEAATASNGHQLQSLVTFNTYGEFIVNETIFQTGNSTSGFSSVTLGFPAAFQGHVASISTHASAGQSQVESSVSTSFSNNTLLFTLSVQPGLPAGTNASASLGFYVMNTFKPINASFYLAPMLFSPSTSIPMDKVVSSIFLPYNTTFVADSTPLVDKGFSETLGSSGSGETWNYTNTSPSSALSSATVSLYSDPSTSGALDFTYANRQVLVDSSGRLTVQDIVTVTNLGFNTVTSLAFQPLTTDTTLTVLPASDPPLSNVRSITLSGGVISLDSINHDIQPKSSITLILQYPLGQQYWNFSNGEYKVSIPTTTPVIALVDKYQVSSSSVPGVIVIGSPISSTGYNTTQIAGNVAFSYRMGVASAFLGALPVAGMLFIAVFIAGLVFRPRTKSREDTGSTFDTLIKTIEDKVSSTNDILSELKSKGVSATRNDLVVARSRIDDVRLRSTSKIGTLRSQLVSPGVSITSGLNEVMANDKSFDAVIRDVLNSYDQHISKRMKDDTFARVQQNNERKLQGFTNALLDGIHDLREEYESEG